MLDENLNRFDSTKISEKFYPRSKNKRFPCAVIRKTKLTAVIIKLIPIRLVTIIGDQLITNQGSLKISYK
ncbi:hypothetical protein BpHYR1_023622 [Brachionus plicatilis]|uniref:Uncharacterized protein n=1 Tax=Brachionus plicatilis TaxID=10195 RepID=A0A3M7PLX3_BRAPC|nr:hypothetical protein BpHYR1_023622 [Brachionus plicatilis]